AGAVTSTWPAGGARPTSSAGRGSPTCVPRPYVAGGHSSGCSQPPREFGQVDGLVCDQALTGYDGAIDEPTAAARTGTGRSIRARLDPARAGVRGAVSVSEFAEWSGVHRTSTSWHLARHEIPGRRPRLAVASLR